MASLSLKENKWMVKTSVDSRDDNRKIIDTLLRQRGIKSQKDKDRFFDPSKLSSISNEDFGLMTLHVSSFTKRITKALQEREKVVIYGDYDADGICATAILWEALYDIGVDVEPFIPSRFEEGYGFNEKGLKRVIDDFHPRLIITVDNGIVAFEATREAKEKGIDVVITDHHQKLSKTPSANLILHTTTTSGAGIAYLLSSHLRRHFKLAEKDKGLDLCVIGMISDQISVIHPNRSLIKYGLEKLNQTSRPGLRAIFEEAGIVKNPKSVYEVGYIIAPRINASGRLYSGMDSLRLLCTLKKDRAMELARKLSGYNKRRQEIVGEVLAKAEKIASKTSWDGAIVIADKSFHEGVIGLAASKLAESYGKPSIVFSVGENESKASGRSISGFDLIKSIRKMKKYLITVGGHPGAVGFSIKTKNLDKFKKEFELVSSKILGSQSLFKTLLIDLGIDFVQINTNLLNDLKKFEPTGIENHKPLFFTENVEIVSYKLVGVDKKHLKLVLRKNEKTFDAIAFSFGSFFGEITRNEYIDIAYYVEENIWNGVSSIDLRISDIRLPSEQI